MTQLLMKDGFVPAGSTTHREHVRSPVDVLRLVVGAVLVAGGVATANLLDNALLGLSDDGDAMLDGLPSWFHNVPGTLMAVALVMAASAAIVWALVTTRYRRLTLLVSAFVGATTISIVLGDVILALVDEPVREAFAIDGPVFRYRNSGGRIHPGDPLLAAGVAMLGVGSSYLRHATTRRLAVLLMIYAAASPLTAGVPALGLVADIGAGLFVASALLLAFGRHELAPHAEEIETALASIGISLQSLTKLRVDARGSTPWSGRTVDGQRVFVKVLGRDERSADLLFRAYRWLRLRKTGDHQPFVSLRRAVEHEALVSLQAASLGMRTPRVLGVAEAGVDGMLLAFESVHGRSADRWDDIDDTALEEIWSMVGELHRKRIAHRDLRLANIFIDAERRPWLIDFGFSELAASDQLLGTDVAELLASTAAVVGPERAVEAAHRATGHRELARAMPWLQPLALSGATRAAIGGAKGLAPIRTILVDVCGIPTEERVKLQRLDGKTAFILGTLALSAYFLIPQLADVDDVWKQIRDASIAWMVVAIGFSLLTYVAATASLLGSIPSRLRFAPALVAQLASSFANRVTPAKVGGLATNLRYFQKRGVPTAVAVTAVGVNAIAGVLVHVGMTVAFLVLASGDGASGGLPVPSVVVLLVGLGGIAVLIGLTMVVPVTRRLIVTNLVPQVRAGVASVRTIGRSPTRLTLLFGGSAVITLAYLGAMMASLEAFGADVSFPTTGLLFLTASAVANAAPTPGGLGAAEAALVAAFTTVEAAEVVVPAVFLYRFVTFWLPILPGWAALAWLRRTDNI